MTVRRAMQCSVVDERRHIGTCHKQTQLEHDAQHLSTSCTATERHPNGTVAISALSDSSEPQQTETMMRTALLVVDVQYDFLPGGSLAVEDGDGVLPIVRELLDETCKWNVVVASQDFHPHGHVSFASTHKDGKVFTAIEVPNVFAENEPMQQMLWPDHCIQGTRGCEIEQSVEKDLNRWIASGKGFIVQKGVNPQAEAYSAFAPAQSVSSSAFPSNMTTNHERSPLASHLLSLGVKRLFVVGLATDYCVRASALDAMLTGGFEAVYIIREGVRAVGDNEATRKCLEEFKHAGVQFVSMEDEVVRRMLTE